MIKYGIRTALSFISLNRPKLNRADSEQSMASSLNSTWNNGSGNANSSSFLFLRPSTATRLAEALHPYAPTDARVQAVRSLLATQPADLVSSPSWAAGLREGLRTALLDSNVNVAVLALKVHRRLLSACSSSPRASTEAFSLLAAAIADVSRNAGRTSGPATASLLFRRKNHQTLTRMTKVLVTSAAEMPRHWARWPVREVQSVVESMVTLMATATGNGSLRPILVLSAVDPKATWVRNWLHSGLGRRHFVKKLAEMNSIIAAMRANVTTNAENRTTEEWSSIRASFRASAGRAKGSIPDLLSGYAHFVFCVHFFCLAARHPSCASILALDQAKTVLHSMLAFVANGRTAAMKGPTSMVADCLSQALIDCQGPAWLRLNEDSSIDLLLAPLRQWTITSTRSSLTFKHVNIAKVLSSLMSRAGPMEDEGRLDVAMQFCALAVQNYRQAPVGSLKIFSSLAVRVLSMCSTRLGASSLVDSAAAALEEANLEDSTPTNSVLDLRNAASPLEKSRNAIQELRSILLACLATPRGVLLLDSTENDALSLALDGRWIVAGNKYPYLALLAQTVESRRGLMGLAERHAAMAIESLHQGSDNWRVSEGQNDAMIDRAVATIGQILLQEKCLKLCMKESPILRSLLMAKREDELTLVFSLRLLDVILTNIDNSVFLEREHHLSENLDNIGNDQKYTDKNSLHLQLISKKLSLGNATSKRPLALSALATGDVKQPSVEGKKKFLAEMAVKVRHICLEVNKSNEQGDRTKTSLADVLMPILLDRMTGDQTKVEDVLKVALTPEIKLAASKMLDYGAHTGHLSPPLEEYELSLMRVAVRNGEFDWFAGAIFILNFGDEEKTKAVLDAFSEWPDAGLFWPRVNPNSEMALANVEEAVEHVLTEEFPAIRARLSEAGVAAASVARVWIRQSFLGVLSLDDIARLILASTVLGSDIVPYVIAALVRHNVGKNEDVLAAMTSTAAETFRLVDNFAYVERLRCKYQGRIQVKASLY